MNTQAFESVLKWVKVVVIVLALFLLAETLGALKNLNSVEPVFNSISVTGEGESVVVPDVATFSFTVSADAAEVGEAQNQVTERMDAILAGLKELGVDDKDIKTTNYSVFPKYKYEFVTCSLAYCPPSRQVQDGFTVSHSISVKIRKMENIGKALAVVGDKGVTNLSDVSFTVDDIEKVREQARAEAIADAKSKAKTLSKALGVRLVRVISFYDSLGGPVPYYANGFGGDKMERSASVTAPTLPAGENTVKVNVTVVYEIR